MAFGASPQHVAASSLRFLDRNVSPELLEAFYNWIVAGESMSIEDFRRQAGAAL